MTPAEQREALVELRRQRNRLRELELRVLVQADRDDVGADSGAVSTPAWLAHATGTSTAACHRDLHLATKLDTRFARTRAALAAGVIDVEKAGIVTDAVERLTGEHDDLPARHRGAGRGAPARARPDLRRPHPAEAGQAALRGGLPRGRRRRRGHGWSGRRPGPGRSRTSRSTTTATAPATAGSGYPPCTRTCSGRPSRRSPAHDGSARHAWTPRPGRSCRTPPCSGTG